MNFLDAVKVMMTRSYQNNIGKYWKFSVQNIIEKRLEKRRGRGLRKWRTPDTRQPKSDPFL
jgi:hypothetical protein